MATMTESQQQPPMTGATEPCPMYQPNMYQPNVDVCDCGSEVMLVTDMPGATAESMTVSFEDGVLAVYAKVPSRSLPGRQIVQEYGIGDYRRSFRLGEGFDASQISAEYRKGVLTIHVPRLAAVRPRRIEVRPA
jgi:HSP20 family protein